MRRWCWLAVFALAACGGSGSGSSSGSSGTSSTGGGSTSTSAAGTTTSGAGTTGAGSTTSGTSAGSTTTGTTGGTGTTGAGACSYSSSTTGANDCGASNFSKVCTLANGNSYTCPVNGTCDGQGGCGCQLGYIATDCSGNVCNGGCSYPNWWCARPAAPTAPAQVAGGTCTTCDLGSPSCPNGQSCVAARPSSSLGICVDACDGSLSCSAPQTTCVDTGGAAPVCYPWACLGVGTTPPACGAAHEPWPQVPNQGDPGLAHLQVFDISYAAWDGGSYPYAPDLESWSQSVFGSSSYASDSASEYDVQSSSYLGAYHIATPPPSVESEADWEAELSALIGSGAVPAPSAGLVYTVFLPSTTTYYRSSSDPLCANLVGYHSAMTYQGQPVPFAVIGGCGPASFFGLDALHSLESLTSHELMEAATDPVNESSWGYPFPFPLDDPWANQGGEVADMCDWIDAKAGGEEVQRNFSNAAAAAGGDPCIPAVSTPAAAVASLPYTVVMPAGGSATVPLVGWSTDPNRQYVGLDFLRTKLTLDPPLSLWVNSIAPVTLTAPATADLYRVTFYATGEGLSPTLWPVTVEAE